MPEKADSALEEVVLRGIGVSPGIARGPVSLSTALFFIPEREPLGAEEVEILESDLVRGTGRGSPARGNLLADAEEDEGVVLDGGDDDLGVEEGLLRDVVDADDVGADRDAGH